MSSGREEVFKYQRLRGALGSTIKSEKITCSCVEDDSVVLGTASGEVFIYDFDCNLIKSYQGHTGSVKDVVFDHHDKVIYSCSDCGTVVSCSRQRDDEKLVLYESAEKMPLHAICIEDAPRKRKDKAYIVGSSSGQLLYRRSSWISSAQRDQKELFQGSGSAVSTLSWRGTVIAWADASQVRVMDIESQTAICYLSSPPNVGVENPFPCSLFWETDMDLLVGWADNFRHLRLVPSTQSESMTSPAGQNIRNHGRPDLLRAKLMSDWFADSIICSISSFDVDHALILGYIPPSVDSSDSDEKLKSENNDKTGCRNDASCVELLCVQKRDGQIFSVDLLPMQFQNGGSLGSITMEEYAPENLRMLSSYSCLLQRPHAAQWSYKSPFQRGGFRNLPPKLLIISPADIVAASVCDVNDRVTKALKSGDIQQAVYLAKKDKYNLRLFSYNDLVKKYITSLLDAGNAEKAAFECSQLLSEAQDGSANGSLDGLWQYWIEEFLSRRRLSDIAPHVPTGDNGYYHAPPNKSGSVSPPRACRLSPETYALFLDHFLKSNSKAFLQTVQSWGTIVPPLFDSREWLEKVNRRIEHTLGRSRASGRPFKSAVPGLGHREWGGLSRHREAEEGDEDWDEEDLKVIDPCLLEAKGHLHSFIGQHRRALRCFLAVDPGEAVEGKEKEFAVGQAQKAFDRDAVEQPESASSLRQQQSRKYQHIFDLIEKKNLFEEVEDSILRLVQFSRPLSEGLLIRHLDQLPVHKVVQQLKSDPILLHWYLHTVFTKAPEVYNSQDYSEFHLMQISLYAHFSSRTAKESFQSAPRNHSSNVQPSVSSPLILMPSGDEKTDSMHQIEEQSDLLKFLNYSNFVSLDTALRECERQTPPLYREIVFILAKMGCVKEGLLLLLRELDDVHLAVKYIESYGPEHWNVVVDHALSHHSFLGELLDMIGSYNRFDPKTLVEKLPPCMEIPSLRQRLLRIVQHCDFQNFLRGKCLTILQEDTLIEIKQLNQAQRKAVKVQPSSSRCMACGRPMSMLPPPHLQPISSSRSRDQLSSLDGDGHNAKPKKSRSENIWGLALHPFANSSASSSSMSSMAHLNDAVIFFPNKIAYHTSCYFHSSEGQS